MSCGYDFGGMGADKIIKGSDSHKCIYYTYLWICPHSKMFICKGDRRNVYVKRRKGVIKRKTN